MLNYSKYMVLSFLMSFCLGYHAHAQKIEKADGCVLIKQKCKLNVKQTTWSVGVGGIDFTSGPVKKVGDVKIGTDLKQKLTDIAQILDQMQMSRCQMLNTIRTCDAIREKLLVVYALSVDQLGQLALLAQMYSGNADKLSEALLKWIVASTDLIQKIYAKQFMAADVETGKNQKIAREALEYAVGKLGISPQSPEFSRLLVDPIRSQLNRGED